jgi:hypothetical protein
VWSFYQEPDASLFLRALHQHMSPDGGAATSARGTTRERSRLACQGASLELVIAAPTRRSASSRGRSPWGPCGRSARRVYKTSTFSGPRGRFPFPFQRFHCNFSLLLRCRRCARPRGLRGRQDPLPRAWAVWYITSGGGSGRPGRGSRVDLGLLWED